MVARPAIRSRPSGATQHRCWKEQLGGAPEGARSYWQGRFAACTFVERVWHTGRPRNSWGVAPNPTRGAASGLRKGQLPLDPFSRFSCAHLHTFSAWKYRDFGRTKPPLRLAGTVLPMKITSRRGTQRRAASCLRGIPAKRRRQWRCGSSCRPDPSVPQPPQSRRRR